MTDEQLLELCQKYGMNALLWRQKFIGLLPEVERRKLYLKKGYSSIFEFAARLGGVSREQVLLVLRLDKSFESTPQVEKALISGEVPLSKLARVASVVNPETQEFWLEKSKLLSKGALEVLVKDNKSMPGHALNSNKTKKKHQTLKIPQSDELQLAPDVRQNLLELQNKGIDVNGFLRTSLKERQQKIQSEKHEIAMELEKQPNSISRYIPAHIKHLIKKEFGEKCAISYSTNKSNTIHHTQRFSLDPTHNPFFLAPLCSQHHEIAHVVDVKVAEQRTNQIIANREAIPHNHL